jgi:hypothetical protein
VTLGQGRQADTLPATRLSGRWPVIGKAAALSRLARVSLLGSTLMLLATSSCIVADPPEYQNPVQTRPVLDVYQANPRTSRVLVVNTSDQVPISVPVRSEDAGEDLSAHFYVDYGIVGPNGLPQNSQTIAASTYADTTREVTLTWKVPMLDKGGCHLLTLIVAHRTSFLKSDNDILDPAKADTDAAIINWWLNVNATSASTLVDCPTVGVPIK